MSGFLDAVDPLGAPAAAPKKKASKKPVRPPSSSSSDSSSSDDEPAPPVIKKKKKKVVAAPAPEEEEVEEPAPVPAPVVKKKKVVAPPPDDEDEEEEQPAPPKKKAAAPAPAPVAAVPAAAAAKKPKKKKVVESSSSDSSDSSSDSDDSEEGAPPRKKKVVKKKAAAAPLPPPGPVQGVNDLLDFFGEPSKPTPAPAPAAAAPAKKKVKQPEPESDSEDSEEEEVPAPKKKVTKKGSGAGAEPVVAPSPAARSCSVADCPNPRVKRGYCATHANDPNAPVAATSMSSFLGDDTDEALEGFQDLEVQPTKRVNKKVPRAQGQPLSPVGDVGLDGEDATPGEYDPSALPGSVLPNGMKKSPKDWRIDFENTSTSLGMNKNIITWNFIWKRQRHIVELHHSTFGGKRKIIVDEKVRVQEKKPFADQSRYDMRVGEGPLSVQIGVQLKAAGLTAFTYELYVERMPYDQANRYYLTHPEV